MEHLCRKLRVPPLVKEKALEYKRLAELKTATIPSSCMASVCIELACTQLDEPVDKQYLQQSSGLHKSAYLTSLQNVKQLLRLAQEPAVRDLCIRFGCIAAEKKAKDLLKRYEESVSERYTTTQRSGINLNKPLYSATALYAVCRLMKIRCDKSKFFAVAASSRAMFNTVLGEMQECASKAATESGSSSHDRGADDCNEEEEEDIEEERGEDDGFLSTEQLESRICCNPLSEEYLSWKKNLIANAREQLLNTPSGASSKGREEMM